MPVGVGVSLVCVIVKLYSLLRNIDLGFLKPVCDEERGES